ncbi:hypothetical protein [Vibrio mangrovi]|nr:hypothetical protein [Vibrio mangrovi]MDW6004427.1 hypothetical protein [Vibrio mangrovi]
MNIENILNELNFADESLPMICSVPSVGLKSRIYIVGQVQENIPGVIIGDREPYLREKTLGVFKDELKTFGPRFLKSDFLMESTHEFNEEEYEVRYYELTHIKIEAGEVVLLSEKDELFELREIHRKPEYE